MTGRHWSPEELARAQALRAEGLTHAAIAAAIGRPLPAVRSQFAARGWTARKAPNWSGEQDWRLLDLLGRHLPYAQIGTKLGRSPMAVRTRACRLGQGGVRTASGDYSANEAATLLGVEHHALMRWVRGGHLVGRHTAVRYARGHMVAIRRADLEAFLEAEAHWHRIDPSRIADSALRDWAIALRGGRHFLRLHQVEARLHYGVNSAYGAVRNGRLRAVRDGQGPWLVRDDWLGDMAAPPRRKPHPLRALRPGQLEELRRRWGAVPAVELARRWGVGVGTVHRAARRLGLPRLGQGYWAKLAGARARGAVA